MDNLLQVILPEKNSLFARDTSDIVDYCFCNGGWIGLLLLPLMSIAMYVNTLFLNAFYSVFLVLLLIAITYKLITRNETDSSSKGYFVVSSVVLLIYYLNVICYYLIYNSNIHLNIKMGLILVFNMAIMYAVVTIIKAVVKAWADLGYGSYKAQFIQSKLRRNDRRRFRGVVKRERNTNTSSSKDVRFNNDYIDKHGVEAYRDNSEYSRNNRKEDRNNKYEEDNREDEYYGDY